MAGQRDLSVSVVGMCPSSKTDISILLNVAEMPVDADSIESFVHDVSVSDGGSKGQPLYSSDEWLTCLASDTQGRIFAGSMEGGVHVFDGSQWTTLDLSPDVGINCVFAADSASVLAGNLEGSLYRCKGSVVTVESTGTGTRINAVHGCAPDCVYAVGDDGIILRFDGRTWLKQEKLTNANLLAVLALSESNIYIAGVDGLVFHWDGRRWMTVDAPRTAISSLALFKGEIFGAGGAGGILKIADERFEQVKPVTIYRLSSTRERLFCAGSTFLAWHDGSSWRRGEYNIF